VGVRARADLDFIITKLNTFLLPSIKKTTTQTETIFRSNNLVLGLPAKVGGAFKLENIFRVYLTGSVHCELAFTL
jgi:hypothetical protein